MRKCSIKLSGGKLTGSWVLLADLDSQSQAKGVTKFLPFSHVSTIHDITSDSACSTHLVNSSGEISKQTGIDIRLSVESGRTISGECL